MNKEKTEQALTILIAIQRLKNLQKWHPWVGCVYYNSSIDWEEDDDGDWIKVGDIEKLIKEYENNRRLDKIKKDGNNTHR